VRHLNYEADAPGTTVRKRSTRIFHSDRIHETTFRIEPDFDHSSLNRRHPVGVCRVDHRQGYPRVASHVLRFPSRVIGADQQPFAFKSDPDNPAAGSTDAGQPLTAVLERSTYVPALNNASFNGGDDFLGSARERLFGFINGQTGGSNPNAQGFQHLVLDGFASQDASAANDPMIDALRHGGDLLNVFGDFPTLSDPRHADAYSPLWDAQLGLWTPKAVSEGLNTRQTDENTVLNLAATRPDLLTGVNPATGAPEPYGAAGVDINCAVLGFTAQAPTTAQAAPVANGQFPPR
jgi:hypothetical protein